MLARGSRPASCPRCSLVTVGRWAAPLATRVRTEGPSPGLSSFLFAFSLPDTSRNVDLRAGSVRSPAGPGGTRRFTLDTDHLAPALEAERGPCFFMLLPVLGSESLLPLLPIYRLKVVFVLFFNHLMMMELRVGLAGRLIWTGPYCAPLPEVAGQALVAHGHRDASQIPPTEASLLLFWGF